MLANGRLIERLEEWRVLTVRESEAIGALDWPKLERCQATKERLMNEISADAGLASGPIHERVNEIVALERQNERSLSAARAKLEAERRVVERASRTVRQLSKAYGSQSSGSWQSYS